MRGRILAHRGYWNDNRAGNSWEAFHAAWDLGFGIETDFRDYKGEVVVEHDLPGDGAMRAADFFDEYCKAGKVGTLAINIKSNGLARSLKKLLEEREITDYFVFDMSVPDLISCLNAKLTSYTTVSEFQDPAPLENESSGVWLDAFRSDWWLELNTLERLSKKNLPVAIVSPELHKRNQLDCWKHLQSIGWTPNENNMICTDFPEEFVKALDL